MGAMQVLGGRKFLMTLLVIGIAIFLEVRSERGLSPTMAGFLVAIVGTFSAVNYAASVKLTPSNRSQGNTTNNYPPVHEKLNDITDMLQRGAANPESLQMLLTTLGTMKDDIAQVKNTSGQIGQAVVALGNRRS